MKKVILIILLVVLTVVLSGCNRPAITVTPAQVSGFVEVERARRYAIVYDKETKVMYAVSYYGDGSGTFTLLVNADGSPKLWQE